MVTYATNSVHEACVVLRGVCWMTESPSSGMWIEKHSQAQCLHVGHPNNGTESDCI